MKRSLFVVLGAFLALQPIQASAQIFNGTPLDVEYLKFIEGSHQGGTYGVQVGPYSGRFEATDWTGGRTTTTSAFALYCVDYLHYASYSTGKVNVSAMSGNLSKTRFGDYKRYRRAAYLSSLFDSWKSHQYALNGEHDNDRWFSKSEVWGGLHAAIWNVATGPDDLGSHQTAYAREYFLAMTIPDDFSTDGWYILSEADVGLDSKYSGQEFLMRVAVPEPSTVLLMLTGLILLVGANRKRLIGLGSEV